MQLSRLQGSAPWNSPTNTSFVVGGGCFFSPNLNGTNCANSTLGQDFEIMVFANGKSFEVFVKMRTNKKIHGSAFVQI